MTANARPGRPGPPGPPGAPGAPGADGADGADGQDGAAGAPGAPGAPGSVWRSGAGAPGGGLGAVGDWYLNQSNGDVYEKTGAAAWTLRDNLTGPAGAEGDQGPQGDPGPAGQDGADGADGAPGADGADGAPGAPGADGRTILNGVGAPGAGLGADGDFYVDTVADAIYGPKTAGAWGAATPLVGPEGPEGPAGPEGPEGPEGPAGADGDDGAPGAPGAAGADGKTVRNGAGAPGGGLGVDGDFYIDTTADAIYGPKAGGAWGSATPLVGPQGPEGDEGPQGPQGDEGPQGDPGPATIAGNAQVADYTLALTDLGKAVEMNAAGATVVTVPPNADVAFPAGSVVEVFRLGAGAVTIAAGAGVTIRSRGGALGLAAQYSAASLRKRATNEWALVGDLA